MKETSDVAKKVFEEYDKNNDGHLTAEELKPLLEKVAETLNLPKATDEDVKKGMDQLDLNKNGLLEFNEFFHFFQEVYHDY